MIEPSVAQPGKAIAREADAGGDEIGIEAGGVRRAHERLQISSRGGFAAGEMNLKHAESGGLLEHARPGFCVEFARRGDQLNRVGAVGAGERAAMRQFRQQSSGRRRIHAAT